MFTKILSLVKRRDEDAVSSSSASFKDAQEEGDLEEEELSDRSSYRAAIYKLNGIEADLVWPSADLRFEDDAFLIINNEDTTVEEEETAAAAPFDWPYEYILSVRQNIPESVQFVETNQTTREWGLHFSSPESAKNFRNELMKGIQFTASDSLARSNLRFRKDYDHLPSSHQAEENHFQPSGHKRVDDGGEEACLADESIVFPRTGAARILQRESDSLTLFCIDDLETSESILIVELTRDLHLEIQDVEKGQVVIWGPYENCNPWRRVWWFLRGLSENMLLVMTHSFGIEEKILKPIISNLNDDSTISEDAKESVLTFGDSKYLDTTSESASRGAASRGAASRGGGADLPCSHQHGGYERTGGGGHGKRCDAGFSSGDDSRDGDEVEEWVADLDEEYGDMSRDPDHPPSDDDHARHKFMEVGANHSFICRAKGVKNQWWDGQNHERDYELHVMNTDAENPQDAYSQVISGKKFVYNAKAVNPTKALIPGYDDARMMFVDGENDPKAVYHFDVEKEKVVTKYDTGGLQADILWRTLKGEQTGQTFMAASSDAFYLMDTRQQKANVTKEGGGGGVTSSSTFKEETPGLSARSYTRQYKTHTNFTAAASDAKGHIAIGNRTGVIRLYDGAPNDSGDFKIAKTQLDAKADTIKSIDTLQDGSWIVATMKECLVLYPTKMVNSEKTGFEMRLGANKPDPLYLTLEPRDIRKYKLEDIDFRPAVFSENQDCIITSTGNLAIIWDLAALRKGKIARSYTIKQTDLVIQETKTTADGKVLVAHPRRVEFLTTSRK